MNREEEKNNPKIIISCDHPSRSKNKTSQVFVPNRFNHPKPTNTSHKEMSLDSMGPSARGGGGGGRGDESSGMGTLSGTRMIHSLSTPSGVDGSISASQSRGGKKLAVRIQMLDDSVTMFQVQVRIVFNLDAVRFTKLE